MLTPEEQRPESSAPRPIQPPISQFVDSMQSPLNVALSDAKPRRRATEEIETLMKERGFPEMERSWRLFRRCIERNEAWSEEKLESKRQRHLEPYFASPRIIGGAVLATSAALATGFYSLNDWMISDWPVAAKALFFTLNVFNAGILTTWITTKVQRRAFDHFEKIMAFDLARMLGATNFRAEQQKGESAARTEKALEPHNIQRWDDPSYVAWYESQEGNVSAVRGQRYTHHTFVQWVLREYLGKMENRKFVPGRFTPNLLEGKKSVTAFLDKFGVSVRANSAGMLEPVEGIALLKTLRAEYVNPTSEGARQLDSSIKAAEEKHYLPAETVQAAIWERDPWVDLTHQEEFFSSASLRGVKVMGRSDMGRLGTFGYVRNMSISALDFSTVRGRLVRARIGAALVETAQGEVAALFVDGVEGSNTLKPSIVRQGIEDYARAAGFSLVLYNAHVHNQIPKRFLRHLKQSQVPVGEYRIRYADDTTREYLDAFLWPFQPFEYQHPRGRVIAHVTKLNSVNHDQVCMPSMLIKVREFVRLNFLNLTVGQIIASTAVLAANHEPTSLPWLLGGAAIALAIDKWHKMKSVRTR